MFLTDIVNPITQVMLDAFSVAASEMMNVVSEIVPIALPVITVIMVVNLGIKVFKLIVGERYDNSEVDMPSWMEEEYGSWEAWEAYMDEED